MQTQIWDRCMTNYVTGRMGRQLSGLDGLWKDVTPGSANRLEIPGRPPVVFRSNRRDIFLTWTIISWWIKCLSFNCGTLGDRLVTQSSLTGLSGLHTHNSMTYLAHIFWAVMFTNSWSYVMSKCGQTEYSYHTVLSVMPTWVVFLERSL